MSDITSFKEHLMDLEEFMAGRAYAGYLAGLRREVKDIEDRILTLRPINENDRSLQLVAYGEWDLAKEMLETFEAARVRLKAKISEMTDLENQNTSVKL